MNEVKNYITRKVVTSEKRTFNGENGEPVNLYRLYIVDDNGGIGSIYSRVEYPADSFVKFKLATDKDGKLKLAVYNDNIK